jgi:CRP/FNR family transcriptional regulator
MSNTIDHSRTAVANPFERFAAAVLPPGVAPDVEARFRSLARHVEAAAGDAPLDYLEQDQIVFVASGATKLVARATLGREQIVAFHFAGDLVSLPERRRHSYSLVALQQSEFLAFLASDFLASAQHASALANEILRRSLISLSRCREKSIMLGRKTAQERLASFLVTMADRIGMQQGGQCVLDLPMSRRDIADSLGLTIETVSRQLTVLRDLALIETSGRSIVTLADIAALEDRAGHLAVAA